MNDDNTKQMNRITKYAIQCLKDEANAVLDLIPQLDENFSMAVEMIYHCKGKVIVTGVGKAGTSVQKLPQHSLLQVHRLSLSIRSTYITAI